MYIMSFTFRKSFLGILYSNEYNLIVYYGRAVYKEKVLLRITSINYYIVLGIVPNCKKEIVSVIVN